MKAIQDYYPEELARCFGCGRLNPEGYHLKSYLEGDATVARFTPRPYHIAVPGFVNGGLLASLVDCHATGTAAAVAAKATGKAPGDAPIPRFVTASLRVDYLRPTPLGPELVLHGAAKTVARRKVVVEVTLEAAGIVTARGEVVCVELPSTMRSGQV
jgi:acyl-coenzyme A thioesterase PaaI-like protein